VYEGFCAEDVPVPSPKSQSQEEIEPDEAVPVPVNTVGFPEQTDVAAIVADTCETSTCTGKRDAPGHAET